MNWKQIGKALAFPPAGLLVALTAVSAAGLSWSMLALEDTHPLRIASYVLAFYTLCAVCARLPRLFRRVKAFKAENRYLRRWSEEPRLRMNVTLSGNVLWNGAYGAMQLGLGIYHRSAWFYALAAYYASLAVMRFCLVRHTLRHKPGENMRRELGYYRACGWIFLVMNLALSAMMFYMIRENRATEHHEITTIAMAAYTFFTLIWAIVNVPRYRKYNSPAMSAARVVSLASALVSLLTLENTMLVTFGGAEMSGRTRQLFLALSGGAVSVSIVIMAITMIRRAGKQQKDLGEKQHGTQGDF